MIWFAAAASVGLIALGVLKYRMRPPQPGPWMQIGRCMQCDGGFEEPLSEWLRAGDRRVCSKCGACDPKDHKNKILIPWIGRWSGRMNDRNSKIYEWLPYEKMPEDMRPEIDPLVRLAKSLEDLK